MFTEFGLDVLLLLALAGFLGGFIDSIAGGGGLITVPALLLAGLTPVEAIGTNKAQSVFGSATASYAYIRAGLVDWRSQLPWAALSFAGAVAGAALATVLPGEWLHTALPVLLVVIALYFAFKPDMDDVDRTRRVPPFLFGVTIVPLIGFYDGLFGPGAGSFMMLAFVALAGYGVLKAAAHTRLINFSSILGSLVFFAAAGVVAWKVALVMGAAQIAGGRLGAMLAMKNGARLIKPLLVGTCVVLAIKLLLD